MPIPHVTGAWLDGEDPGDRKFIKIGDIALESGEVLPDVTIAYQSWGKLNSNKDNAILVNHAWTGWSDVESWWPNQVGPGKPLDTDKYFVVCPNVIGGCQGSTGPASKHPDGKFYGSRFPSLTIRDMVEAEVAFTNALGINKYVLSCGPSLGGMRSLEWAVQYPERIGGICTIGSSAVATGDQIGSVSIQVHAIKSDPNFNGGDYYDLEYGPEVGMGIARKIAHLTFRTEIEMDMRFGRELQGDDTGRYAVESYLDHQADKLAQRFDANTYIILGEAMNSHDIGRDRGGVSAALSTITVPVMVVSIDTDRLFPPRLQQELAELTPGSKLEMLSSPFGHDGFLVESDAMGELLRHAIEHAEGTHKH